MEQEKIRLSKLMSELGICSRREADVYIEAGQVSVDGVIVDVLGTKVSPDARVHLLPEAREYQSQKLTIMLNKPLGYVSTQPEDGHRSALELLRRENCIDEEKPEQCSLHKMGVAGRLDIDSKGLLLFSQDGVFIKSIIGPESDIEKEYLVRLEGDVNHKKLELLRCGLSLDGVPLKRAKVDVLDDGYLRFTLREGKKRQIRRMCEMVNLQVLKLKRVRIGSIRLGDLPEGKWTILHNVHDTR